MQKVAKVMMSFLFTMHILRFYFVLLALAFCSLIHAEELSDLALSVKVDQPEVALSDAVTSHSMAVLDSIMAAPNSYMTEEEKAKAAYRAKYGGYTPLKELEWTSVPLITFGLLAKANKKNFRAARNNFIPTYKNVMDDYIQFSPAWAAFAMNMMGYKGRSSFKRMFFSSGFSYAFMGIFVNSIKYSAAEMRPDGSTANSFPSGHTATAFTSATIMHKEYGLTRSPWFSVGAYGIATLTGIMRTLNNRHWISDILVGAGLGVISTDLGYMMADFWFKDKGIKNLPLTGNDDLIMNPSFFRLSLGMQGISDIKLPTNVAYITNELLWAEPGSAGMQNEIYCVQRNGNPFHIPDDFSVEEPKRTYSNYANGATFHQSPTIKVGTGTSVNADAAYFFTSNVGIGARARITTAPVVAQGLAAYDDKHNYVQNSSSATDIWSLADVAAGFYFSLPLTRRQAIGAKTLFGHRYYGSLDLSGVYDAELQINGKKEYKTFYGDNLYIYKADSDLVSGGISYTYAMGNGVALSAFCDYDFSRVDFDVEYQPYNRDVENMVRTYSEFNYKQKVQSVTLGASMVVMF